MVRYVGVILLITFVFFLFFSFFTYVNIINRNNPNFWLLQILNSVVGLYIFGLILIAFRGRLGTARPKKEKRYIDKKKARLCYILTITGVMIMSIVGISVLYLNFLIPEEIIIDLFGLQSPIPWLYNVLISIGVIMAILGLIMGVRGALEEIEQV